MEKVSYRELSLESPRYWGTLVLLGILTCVALAAAFFMEHHGHWVTGMSNQIVWGMPHVFAIFLIVAASGALNVASIGTVFGKPMYKPLGRFSGMLAIALLAGGLAVLVLDLGRPDRLIVAMTKYNFKSIFAWNIYLYTGFFVIVGFYLWSMMDRTANRFYKPLGVTAFIWRLILTTGTGSIFGFLVAREAYDAAILAPMFIINSFAYGLACFILVLMAVYWWSGKSVGQNLLTVMKRLLGVFVGAVLYFAVIYHLANLYVTQHHGVEAFILLNGGIYTQLFWIGQILIGGIIPLFLIYSPAFNGSRFAIIAAPLLVIIGGLCQVYVTVIGGQAYPMTIFPGKEVVESGFFDGMVNSYSPTLAETLLGLGGIVITLIMMAVTSRMLPLLPERLEDPEEA